MTFTNRNASAAGRLKTTLATSAEPRSRRAEKFFERRFALAEAAGEYDHRVEREQRRREIAVRGGGEQIAADGRRLAHRRTADSARHRMQKCQVALGEDRRHA